MSLSVNPEIIVLTHVLLSFVLGQRAPYAQAGEISGASNKFEKIPNHFMTLYLQPVTRTVSPEYIIPYGEYRIYYRRGPFLK